jgi:hypothetical protein
MIVVQKYRLGRISRTHGAMIGRNEGIAENNEVTQKYKIELEPPEQCHQGYEW